MNVQDGSVRRLLAIQALLAVGVAGAFLLSSGLSAAGSALYGGAIALASSTLLGRSLKAATEAAKFSPNQGTRTLYLGAVQRFLLVLGLLAVGMGLWRLPPLALIAGFAGAQAAFLFGGIGATPSSSAEDREKRE